MTLVAGVLQTNHTAQNCRTGSCLGLERRQHGRGLHAGMVRLGVSLDHTNLARVVEMTGYWSHRGEGPDSAGAKVEEAVGVPGLPT